MRTVYGTQWCVQRVYMYSAQQQRKQQHDDITGFHFTNRSQNAKRATKQFLFLCKL